MLDFGKLPIEPATLELAPEDHAKNVVDRDKPILVHLKTRGLAATASWDPNILDGQEVTLWVRVQTSDGKYSDIPVKFLSNQIHSFILESVIPAPKGF